MEKVGLSKAEIKKTIHSQVLKVFFLPLIMAVIHIAFAFKMMVQVLALLSMSNIQLFLLCTVVTILIFAVIYALVYEMTAKTYYKIVN
ncbi:MAG: ABC transporter permease, partial [Lachnospiraceae bacterium]|nr:ABC transporter permease [Lachnospiraceae bacterium]